MVGLIVLAMVAVASLVSGAYGHKWLAQKTGAPANLNAGNAVSAAKTVAENVTKDVKAL